MNRLLTLGALDLRTGEGSELRAVLAQPRRLALLAFLGAATPRGFHRRDRLLALFWPDQDRDRARASLNRAVYFLRRELGDDVVRSRGVEEVGMDGTRFWCDAAAFGDALDDHRYREALELYRGDLLPGFFVSDARGFEDWLESERARLRERASVAAWALADEEEKAGSLGPAVYWARRGLELSPFRELGLRRLLALLDRAGDRADAAREYERFAGELTAELDLDPSPETRALIDAIRSRAMPRTGLGTSLPNDDSGEAPSTPIGLRQPPSSAPRPRRKMVRWALPVIAFSAVLTAATVLLARDETLDPMRIDVASFENLTGDPTLDALARTATDRVIGGLGQTGLFQSVAPVPHGMPGGWRAAWTGLTGLAIRSKGERGGVIVSGAITLKDGTPLIQSRLTDVNRGGRVWEVAPIPISLAAPENGASELRARVIGGAAALRDSYFASLLPVATPPPTFEAYQEFQEAWRLQGTAEAGKHYRLAVALDSSFTLALVHAAWSALIGPRPRIEEADSSLRVLKVMRDRLPPLQRHLTDHMVMSRALDWVGAYRAIRAAANIAPIHYGYRAALRASYLCRPREALEALLRPGMDSAHRRDVRAYWLMVTLSYHQLGEYGNELDAARRARSYSPESRSAITHEIRALTALGNIDGVRARLDTLLAMPMEGWFHPGWAMIGAAEELRFHGHPAAAREIAERAVDWHRSRPAGERNVPVQLWHLAHTLYFLERWEEVKTIAEPLVAEFPNDEDYLGLLGAAAARRGDRVTAEAIAAKLAGRSRSAASPGTTTIINRAKIAALLGDKARAVSLLKDAYGEAGTLELHTDVDFEGLRDYPPFQELTKPKG